MKSIFARASSLIFLTAIVSAPVHAQDDELLQQQLDAQIAINEQLRRRLEMLENQLAGEPVAPALRPREETVTVEQVSEAAATAIAEALTARGLVLLTPGNYRFGFGFDQVHDGSESRGDNTDASIASLSIQAGLPKGMMLSANLPYEKNKTPLGSNRGVGDFSIALSRLLNNESARMPMLIASLSYTDDNGKDPFELVPIGSGFRNVGVSMSAVKSISPLVVYGRVGYTKVQEGDIRENSATSVTGHVEPGSSWSYALGTSLAATPTATLGVSLLGALQEETTGWYNNPNNVFTSPSRNTAFLSLSSGFILNRRSSLLLSATAGITNDSPDYIFSLYVPYRF